MFMLVMLFFGSACFGYFRGYFVFLLEDYFVLAVLRPFLGFFTAFSLKVGYLVILTKNNRNLRP